MNYAAIKTTNLTKNYGRHRGIVDLNLYVEPGEIFGFIGPNGAGKSTTIRTLLGLLFPTSGSGAIFGLDIVKQSKEIKKQIGFMPSEVGYYHRMKIRELLDYSARFYEIDAAQRIEELAHLFALELDRKILDLSRGNQKKVSILQSLLHRPRLLILDEPTSGLDPLMQAKYFNILREENSRGTTVFFSSHTLSEVQAMCRRVAIVREGRIAAVEDIESLRKKQLRKIQVEFDHPVQKDSIACRGIISPCVEKNTLEFMFSGRMEELIENLTGKGVRDLIIEEPTLEEIFMHYYSDTEQAVNT
ncbi:MAG: ABC transporter ATP-binding protein [Acidobacteria bacterium]|nr:ABC transporter ATP-binding protein [Acidobacteriota bacterium]MBU1475353.1 ABC transporter ATP-binding protein [Acidobacteriota bacterium]MBU2438395.1 ABC transporter ATP-binding protein [Acidobacteriota bacterium]